MAILSAIFVPILRPRGPLGGASNCEAGCEIFCHQPVNSKMHRLITCLVASHVKFRQRVRDHEGPLHGIEGANNRTLALDGTREIQRLVIGIRTIHCGSADFYDGALRRVCRCTNACHQGDVQSNRPGDFQNVHDLPPIEGQLAIFMTWTALSITSALRFWPWGPLGIVGFTSVIGLDRPDSAENWQRKEGELQTGQP